MLSVVQTCRPAVGFCCNSQFVFRQEDSREVRWGGSWHTGGDQTQESHCVIDLRSLFLLPFATLQELLESLYLMSAHAVPARPCRSDTHVYGKFAIEVIH
jgi:hypothetical protein